jgi:hypothetical protein
MALQITRFSVRIECIPRVLFSVFEKPNGELIIPIRTAERLDGPDGPRLREQRYSIHPSPRSADYTTIKQTINADSSRSITSVVLTDAVKKKSGFSIVFVRRVQDLNHEKYTLRRAQKKGERIFVLADLDPVLHTFFFGIFLCHPETKFDASAPGIVVSLFPFKEFKIVILATALLMPTHYTSDFAHAVTQLKTPSNCSQ